ncbi:MAG: VIT and vWA domain-containing protein [Planctomycetota bacterium]|jgi:PAS domain-containing protein
MSNRPNQPADPGNEPTGSPSHDELDDLLQQWHTENTERAAAGRDALMARVRAERRSQRARAKAPSLGEALLIFFSLVRRAAMNRYSPVAASALAMVVVIAVLLPGPSGQVYAQEIMVPEGGRLDALDEEGNILGACPLEHTEVDARISGFFSRVNITQTYHNPYERKIEAVYTFPLSHRAAVDRMTMTVGDRVTVGEVKERRLARQIYEAARKQGYVASLLEQERPNIFTQSVANLEPDAKVTVEISYVEVLDAKDGTYSFDFPMVVGPRYIPGASVVSPSVVPAELKPRQGLVLLGPARLTVGAAGNLDPRGSLQAGKLEALINTAQPIKYPGDTWWGHGDATGGAGQAVLWYRFEAQYCNEAKELGELYTDGTGHLNGRWFYADAKTIEGMGTGFSQDTNQVPDASRITPMPVKPTERAGHDISVSVTIDTGGPGLVDVESELHKIVRTDEELRDDDLPHKLTLALANKKDIPNRDFVLSWRQTSDTIQEATFAHTSDGPAEDTDGFFTLILQPPDRMEDGAVPPRELVFVMDTSGSMRGFPLEKSKAVMTRAIGAMRPADTFNVITFAGSTRVMWDKPRPATKANRAEARAWVESQQGRGGTEMMQAINTALIQTAGDGPVPLTPRMLVNLPADNRPVDLVVGYERLHAMTGEGVFRISLDGDLSITLRVRDELPMVLRPEGVVLRLSGRWRTEDGRRVLVVDRVEPETEKQAKPLRIVLFLTDGYVGNEMAIIDAVRNNAHTTRVFSFGIGNSVNRYLLDGMARAGRGEVEYVLLNADADEAVERFTKRVETPVLTDIELTFSEELEVVDLLPSPVAIPDLFDAKPLVIHGRYRTPAKGTVTIRGRTGAGAYERTFELDLPQHQEGHDVIATLWARAKVEQVMAPHLKTIQEGYAPEPVRQEIIALGEQFQIMTQFTSFVAVEKSRLTIGGKPVLVAVPIEMPEGVSYEGVFGEHDAKEVLGQTVGGGTITFPWQQGARQEGTTLGRPSTPASTPTNGRSGGVASAPRPSASPADKGKRAKSERAATESRVARGAPLPPTETGARRGGKRDAPGKSSPGFAGGRGGGGPQRPSAPGKRGKPAPAADAPAVAGEALWEAAGPAEPEAERLGVELRDTVTFVDSDRLYAANQVTADELKQVFERYHASETAPMQVEPVRLDSAKDREEAWVVPQLAQIPRVEAFFKMREPQAPVVGGRPIYAQHVALVIGARVDEGKIQEARSLAEALAQARPDYAIGMKMRDTLADGSLDQADVQARIAALAKQAEQELAVARAEMQRRAAGPWSPCSSRSPTTRQRWHFRRPASRSRPRRSPCRSSWARWTQQTWRPSPCSMRSGGSRRRVWRWRGTSPGARWRVQR